MGHIEYPLCNDDIESEHADNRHTRGGVEREHLKLLNNSNCSSYPLIIDITKKIEVGFLLIPLKIM